MSSSETKSGSRRPKAVKKSPSEWLQLLVSGDAAARREAAVALMKDTMRVVNRATDAWATNEAARHQLAEAVYDSDPKVSESAAMALGRIVEAYAHDSALKPALLRQLRHPSFSARRWAIQGLAVLGGEDLSRALLPLTEDPSPVVREVLFAMVARLAKRDHWSAPDKQPWVQAALATLDARPITLRNVAVNALAAVGDARVLPALEQAFARETDPIVREAMEVAKQKLRP